jgi:hypothetical protein
VIRSKPYKEQSADYMGGSRYVDLHRAAIGFPEERFNYVGIDDDKDLTDFHAGEVRASSRSLR